MIDPRLQREAVLRVGEVTEVTGRKIAVTVDKDKNLSELFFEGDLLRNVAVGSYIDIRKGFFSLIGKVDGEYARSEAASEKNGNQIHASKRSLTISLVGYIDRSGEFFGGTKELPLVGNEAYLLTREKVHQIHNLVTKDAIPMNVAVSDYEGFEISLPVDGLMNSHIAIFGNTGSGKSNTVALLYQTYIETMRQRNQQDFDSRVRVLFFDFNGEYSRDNCLTERKTVYHLSTRHEQGDKIPLSAGGFLDFETISILSDATEKTQRPFIKRALDLAERIRGGEGSLEHLKNTLRMQITQILQMADKERSAQLMDYLRQILPPRYDNGAEIPLEFGIDWNNRYAEWTYAGQYLRSSPEYIPYTEVYQRVESYDFANDVIHDFIVFCYVQLIWDVLSNRAQNEHIAPAINKLKSKQGDIRKVLDPQNLGDIFRTNIVVINLHDVNTEMKKTLPLLISKRIYQEQKDRADDGTALSLVIDEAHNILSYESSRESESWKDYRLETFEEIIKEGRKFGVFVTVSSQRPSDISQTITSQAHNYFIHRLINHRDLQSISTAVSYIDKLTEESIPTLPTGTCVFSGMAGQMPMKLSMRALPEMQQPRSTTRKLSRIVPQIDEGIIDPDG